MHRYLKSAVCCKHFAAYGESANTCWITHTCTHTHTRWQVNWSGAKDVYIKLPEKSLQRCMIFKQHKCFLARSKSAINWVASQLDWLLAVPSAPVEQRRCQRSACQTAQHQPVPGCRLEHRWMLHRAWKPPHLSGLPTPLWFNWPVPRTHDTFHYGGVQSSNWQ